MGSQLLVVTAAVAVVAGSVACAPAQPSPSPAPAMTHVAQGSVVVDPTLARQGRSLYSSRGCNACHMLGRRGAGPDLIGVTDRREPEWIARFLADTSTMLATDPIAMELLEEWRGIKMPNITLSAAQIQALIHYLADETNKAR